MLRTLHEHFCIRLASLFVFALLLASCASSSAEFVAPDDRPRAASEQDWPTNGLLALAYHDVQDDEPDQRFLAVRTDQLIAQLQWLYDNDYQAVSVNQILAARQGGPMLPPKAVLLSFDDGYSSFYTRVLPILQAFNWPAVWAPVGKWVDTPPGVPVDFGGQTMPREHFATWDQVKKAYQSGLVEIAAHTYGLHEGIPANPQGNTEPAASTHRYDAASGQYESEQAFHQRLSNDVRRINKRIHQATGQSPRVWAWPYGSVGGMALHILGERGYQITLTLQDGLGTVDHLMNTPRMLVADAPDVGEFVSDIADTREPADMRIIQLDLDYVYDPDPVQMQKNMDAFIQRIADMRITAVFLQAFADPQGDGLACSVYFPNRWLPMRADIFNHVAWQLLTRANTRVYAWMPVLSFALDPAIERVTRWDPDNPQAAAQANPRQYPRLSPFDPRAREAIIGLYEDLARNAPIDGLLFHDDALLSDFEDASPSALAAYRRAGLPGSIAELRKDPATLQRWARFKTRALIDLTDDITRHVKAIRGPQIKTVRNIYAEVVLNPESETWFAQNLDDFLTSYTWTAPMAMPLMEKVPMREANAWIDSFVVTLKKHPNGLQRSIVELQSRDWELPGKPSIDSRILAGWMRQLKLAGVRNYGYYPDDFLHNEPELDTIVPALSNAWYPYK